MYLYDQYIPFNAKHTHLLNLRENSPLGVESLEVDQYLQANKHVLLRR